MYLSPILYKALAVTLFVILIRKKTDIKTILLTIFGVFFSFWLLKLSQMWSQACGMDYIKIPGTLGGQGQTGGATDECQAICQPMPVSSRLAVLPKTHAAGLVVSRYKNVPGEIPIKQVVIKNPDEIDIHQAVPTSVLCKALKQAGFDSSWTMDKVMNMARNELDRRQLDEINIKVLDQTNMQQITHSDIGMCYPSYIRNYQCKYDPERAKDQITVKFLNKVQKANESKILKSSNCNWTSIKRDLQKSVASHFSAPTKEVDYQKTIILKSYVNQRAQLEFRNLINMFQDKPKKEWLKYLSDNRAKSPSGLAIPGIDYYIPWDLFVKYQVCFGIKND